MESVKQRRKLKGIPRKSNARRKARKYESYRMRVGKPLGRGVPGNKSGKNKV
jgi:hypothetical protein